MCQITIRTVFLFLMQQSTEILQLLKKVLIKQFTYLQQTVHGSQIFTQYLQQMIVNGAEEEERPSLWQYLKSYKQLSNPNHSKTANRRLLQIQDSQQAWAIAHELLTSTNPEYCLHGAQLLSKKLNVPPTPQIDLLNWLPFLNTLPNKSSLVWLCMAKILVHISPKTVVLPNDLTPPDQLRLLREIPAALSHVRTQQPMDAVAMKEAYLALAVPVIASQHNNHPDLILLTIDAFVSYGVKVRDRSILRFLLAMPFEDGGHILEQALGRQKCPELQTEIFAYLQRNIQEESAFSLFVTFIKQIDVNAFPKESLHFSLTFILTQLEKDDADARTRLSDSYELWAALAQRFKNPQIDEQVKQLICNCLLVIWKITCKRSVLSVIPELTVSTGPLELSEQTNSETEEAEDCPQNRGAEIFRDYAGDFFVLIIETLSGYDSLIDSMIKMVEELASGELLHLQLSIYIVVSLAVAKGKVKQLFSAPLRTIFGRSKEMTEYVCSRVVAMIGELGEILPEISDLLAPALLFLSQCLLYSSLAPLASTSLSNLLQEIKIQSTPTLAETMQSFLGQVFQVIFGVNCAAKVVQHLTRSMTIFVYKVKYSPSAYAAYLSNYGQRCSQMPKQAQPKMVQAAVLAQLWINSREQIRNTKSQQQQQKITQKSVFNEFMVPFANFMEQQAPLLLWWVQNSDRKQVFTERVNIITTFFRTNSIGSKDVWAQVCDVLLTKYLEVKPPLPAVISLLSNLTRATTELKIQDVARVIFKGLKRWHRPITSMLDFTHTKCDFSMTCAIVTLHLRIVQLTKVFPQCVTQIEYKPQLMVDYLTGLLVTSEIWEYQVFKFSLQYLLIVLQLGYPPLPILTALLKSFGRLQESLWTSLDPLLFFIYKQYGFGIYQQVLSGLKSGLADLQNPLSVVLKQAFEKDERKTVKNLFLSL